MSIDITVSVEELRKRKIFIATPMYGGMCLGQYCKSTADLAMLAANYQMTIQFFYLYNESLITRARKYLVDEFLRSECTHMMFIDADIGFNPQTIIRMLELDKDVVTGVYPRKTFDWRKIKKRVKDNKDISEDELHAASLQYNLNVKNPERVEVKNGFIELLDGATGFKFSKKHVF